MKEKKKLSTTHRNASLIDIEVFGYGKVGDWRTQLRVLERGTRKQVIAALQRDEAGVCRTFRQTYYLCAIVRALRGVREQRCVEKRIDFLDECTVEYEKWKKKNIKKVQ